MLARLAISPGVEGGSEHRHTIVDDVADALAAQHDEREEQPDATLGEDGVPQERGADVSGGVAILRGAKRREDACIITDDGLGVVVLPLRQNGCRGNIGGHHPHVLDSEHDQQHLLLQRFQLGGQPFVGGQDAVDRGRNEEHDQQQSKGQWCDQELPL